MHVFPVFGMAVAVVSQAVLTFANPPAEGTTTISVTVDRGQDLGQSFGSLFEATGPSLFVSTSAKSPMEWQPENFPFLAPEKCKSYGEVYRLTMPGAPLQLANCRLAVDPACRGI